MSLTISNRKCDVLKCEIESTRTLQCTYGGRSQIRLYRSLSGVSDESIFLKSHFFTRSSHPICTIRYNSKRANSGTWLETHKIHFYGYNLAFIIKVNISEMKGFSTKKSDNSVLS